MLQTDSLLEGKDTSPKGPPDSWLSYCMLRPTGPNQRRENPVLKQTSQLPNPTLADLTLLSETSTHHFVFFLVCSLHLAHSYTLLQLS